MIRMRNQQLKRQEEERQRQVESLSRESEQRQRLYQMPRDLDSEYTMLLKNLKRHFFGNLTTKMNQLPTLLPNLTEPLHALKSRILEGQTPEERLEWLAFQMANNRQF